MSHNINKLGLKRLAGNTATTLGRQLTVGVLQLATIVIIARSLGPEGNGQYAVALLLPTMLATLLNLGIAPANVYFLGANKINAVTVFWAINRLAFFIVIAGLGAGAIIILVYSDNLFPNVPQIVLWIALSIFPFSLFQSFLFSIFQGLQKFNILNFLLLIQPIVNLLLVLLLLLFKILSLKYVLMTYLISLIFMVCMGLLKIKPEIFSENASSKQKRYLKQVTSYGYKAHLSNILAFVNYKTDIFLINLLISSTAAGIYIIAVRLVERLWLLSQSVSTVILPRLSELSSEEEKRKLLTPIICRTVTAITMIAAVLLACLAYPFIILFFGNEYLEAVLILILLLPGIIAGSGARILANDIAARGRPELNMYFSLIVVTVNIVGNVLLIPTYGLEGAAIATTFAYIVNLSVRLLVYKQISGNGLLTTILLTTDDVKRMFNALKKYLTYDTK